MSHPVLAAVERLDPIDLDTVERRASLQRRVDCKDRRCDETLAERGIEPVAMSTYRTGIAPPVTDEPQDAATGAAERFALEGAPA